MSENKQYENEYKVQAVKLAKKIGAVNAANELQIPVNTLYGWIRKAKSGSLDICGAIIHSDRGSQYTSSAYRAAIQKYGIVQSMNSTGGRCHDNARCESIWARMKEELFYNRGRRSENYTIEALKTMVWRYFMSYWSNRRICSAIGGIPPAVKRRRFYSSLTIAA